MLTGLTDKDLTKNVFSLIFDWEYLILALEHFHKVIFCSYIFKVLLKV